MKESTEGNLIGTLRRSAMILRALAADHYHGRALTDLASAVGLPHPTVHRLLAQLSAEGLVVQEMQSKRYRLGPLVYELGLAAGSGYDLGLIYQPAMHKVSRVTGDTSYVIMRSGFEAVCVARSEGSHPVRTLTLNIGSRRPLGVGAGGLAILAACAEDEARWIVSATKDKIRRFGRLSISRQLKAIEESRVQGYATVTNQVSLGVTGVGMAFLDSNGAPLGAISVGALTDRLPRDRHAQIAKLLKNAVDEIEAGLKAMPTRPWAGLS
ncbi:IclR family transcriptional regulator [Ottowia thiooxydans]|uniref:IclR family transcriptional regulator n=1 Tax=Ottowia thiooxydans TaxID=219182 RepID=UPI0003F97656|nr:IclR family transcriptional regulator [Ottowia thiooxydans]